MPFTPLHMGPGIMVKALLQGSFSLTVFGWTQIVMDVQPLIVILTGEGQLHGFTHTYVGATLIAVLSAPTGRYLSEWALVLVRGNTQKKMNISWRVAVASALVGSYRHVVLDSIMHGDLEPLFPFSQSNCLLGILSVSALYQICVYSGLFGAALYFAVHYAHQA